MSVAAIGTWFLTSRLGQTIILAGAMAAAAGATYWYIDDKAYDRGKREAEAKCTSNQSKAKTDLLNDRAGQVAGSSGITAKSDAAAAAAAKSIDTQTNRDKEQNHEDFKKPGQPVAGCVLALPGSVQDRLDAAVERAND